MAETSDNVFDPRNITNNVLFEGDNEDVRSFIGLIQKSKDDPNRIKKMQQIEEDRGIYNDQFALLPRVGSSDQRFDERRELPPMMKSSLYRHLYKKYETDGKKIPRWLPKKEGQADLDKAIVDSVRDQVFQDGGFEEIYNEEIFQQFKWQGTAVIQVGYEGEYVGYSSPLLENMHFDPAGTKLQSKSARPGQICKWAVQEIVLEYKDFEQFLRDSEREDLIGRVSSGSPGSVTPEQQAEAQEGEELTDSVTMHFCTSITRGKPNFMIYAGSSATIITQKTGENYPFKKRMRGKKKPQAILPYDLFHFDGERFGLYSDSMIGIIKDGAESLKKLLNRLLPNIARAVNPYIILAGDDDQRTIEEMKIYNEMQNLGHTPIIQTPNDVKVSSVAPDSGPIWNAYIEGKKEILDDLGERVRVNFRVQEQQDQTATEFTGKIRQENTQIAGLNKLNVDSFAWVAEFSVDLTQQFAKKSDDREIYFSVTSTTGEAQDFQANLGEVLAILEDWTGTFAIDPDLKATLSEQEKRIVRQNTFLQLQTLLQGLDYQTKEEAMPFVKLQYQDIVANQMENDISMKDLNDMVESILERRKQQLEQAQALEEAGQAAQGQLPEEAAMQAEQVPQAIAG